ncbi:MAG: hypothetical protein KDD25_04005 [Bdellovibrionales bacterium]|nr:hypothetical protein [Bdellovibrionales bacterium]
MRTLLIFVILLLHWPSVSFGYLEPYAKKRWKFELRGDYYTTSENLNDDSETESLNGNQFTVSRLIPSLQYDFAKDLSTEIALPMSYAISQTSDEDRERFGLQSVDGAIYWLALSRPFIAIPNFQFKIPTSGNDPDGDEVYIGESAFELIPGVTIGKNFDFFTPEAYIGYDIRGEGRSHLFRWKLIGGFTFGDFYFSTGAVGFESVSDDAETGEAEDRLETNARVNGNSLIYDSVNPSIIKWSSELQMRISSSWRIGIGADFDLAGTRTSYGQLYFLNISYSQSPGAEEDLPKLIYRDIYDTDSEENDSQFEAETYESEKVFERALKPESEPKKVRPKQRVKSKKQDIDVKLRKVPKRPGPKSP